MQLSPVVARIGEIAAFKKSVAGAASYAKAVRDGFKVTPSAFVIPLAETPQPNPFANQIVSHVTSGRIGVVIAAQNKRDSLGGNANDDLQALRDAVFAKLLNWSPATGYSGFEWAAGALIDLDDQVLFWQDDFVSQFTVRSA